MKTEENNGKGRFDMKKFAAENKKQLIAVGSAIILILLLLTLKPQEGHPSIPLQTGIPTDVLDSAILAKQKAQKDILGPRPENGAPSAPKGKPLPPPAFVTSNRDTLIWENGIYKKVGTLKPLNEPKDTLEIDGEKYIRAEIVEQIREDQAQPALQADTTTIKEHADTASQSGRTGQKGH